MHSGGAQTALKNNRKLLKKHLRTHKKFKRWRSLSDDKYKRTPDKSLITLSASERRAYGKRIRRRRKIEFVVIMTIVIVVIFIGIKLLSPARILIR